ncbi:MAG: hypothetical protein II936_01700 [Oscillospiraceae bacterium]|nr:hypothetical protein [Oscillospiraceae bacterium]
MHENIRNNYFLGVRMALLIIIVIYTNFSCSLMTGASVRVLLLLAFYIGFLTFRELADRKVQLLLLAAAGIVFCILYKLIGSGAMLMGVFAGYEVLTYLKPRFSLYFVPVLPCLIMALQNMGGNEHSYLVISLLLMVIYLQNDKVVDFYAVRTKENDLNELSLKHDMDRKEHEMKEQLQKSLLMAENQVLEERTQLSQTLHDKLGHNINGSVYQLEAVKVLMKKDPERAGSMIQAVIDQLRTGMDEIRAILRNKRPEKHRLAAVQLERLCEDCRDKGIEAELITDGELSAVPDNILEVILDNCFEAVSNSLKYAKCTKIIINICVMNKMVRCSISDNGVGCPEIKDGMGLSGIRRRVRQANGMVEIDPEMGFKVNMLFPMR